MSTAAGLRRAADLLGGIIIAARLARHDGWSRAQLAAHQRARCLRMAQYARANIPLYRDMYQSVAGRHGPPAVNPGGPP